MEKYTFRVTAAVKLAQGKASSEAHVQEEIRQRLLEANPGEISPEENEYHITGWAVIEQ